MNKSFKKIYNADYIKNHKLSNKKIKEAGIELLGLDEIFSQIPKWKSYFLSNYGRLLRKNSKGQFAIINPTITKNGYLTYTLSKPARNYLGEKVRDKNGIPKNIRKCSPAQKLVAILYVNNPYSKEYTIDDLQIHHKDKNKVNNYYKNLMFLCKNKNGRKDHDFIHSIKKVALYNEKTTKFHTYKDIEILLKRIDVDILEFIDSIKYNDKLFQDGEWDIYQINGYFVGLRFVKK